MVERSVRRKREKARRGRSVNPKSLPKWLQYDHGTGQLTFDDEWAEVGRILYRLFVGEDFTLREVSRRFRDLGIPSPSGRLIWPPTTLRNWLTHPAAQGQLYQLRYETVKRPGSRAEVWRMRPQEDWFLLKVPALVTEEIWEAAQRRRERHKAFASRNTRRE